MEQAPTKRQVAAKLQAQYDSLEVETRGKLENLRVMKQVFESPGWKPIIETIAEVKASTISNLIHGLGNGRMPTSDELFHLQGRVCGLEVIENLQVEAENEANEAIAQLNNMRQIVAEANANAQSEG